MLKITGSVSLSRTRFIPVITNHHSGSYADCNDRVQGRVQAMLPPAITSDNEH